MLINEPFLDKKSLCLGKLAVTDTPVKRYVFVTERHKNVTRTVTEQHDETALHGLAHHLNFRVISEL